MSRPRGLKLGNPTPTPRTHPPKKGRPKTTRGTGKGRGKDEPSPRCTPALGREGREKTPGRAELSPRRGAEEAPRSFPTRRGPRPRSPAVGPAHDSRNSPARPTRPSVRPRCWKEFYARNAAQPRRTNQALRKHTSGTIPPPRKLAGPSGSTRREERGSGKARRHLTSPRPTEPSELSSGLRHRAGSACEEEASAAVTTHQALSGSNRTRAGPWGL
ncbi:unnamed protein product [Bubo scandiacus]